MSRTIDGLSSHPPTAGSISVVLRDIARGGLAGAVTGIVVAGLGGRVVMRLAAIAVPAASGRFTENGNQVGVITMEGTLALVLFGGLFFGVLGGTIWVVVSPWIPGKTVGRAILAAPIAVALTGIGLIKGSNPDFLILRHDAMVVAMLLGLVALAGLTVALMDTWLDARIPQAGVSGKSDAIYASLSLAGGLLILPLALQLYLAASVWLWLALIAVGLATLAWWWMRHKGRQTIPSTLLVAGRTAFVVAVVLGVLDLAPDVARALGA